MLKIALYCNAKNRKEVEPTLADFLTEKNIDFEIHHVGSAPRFLNDYYFQKDFQLLLTYSDNNLSYILKTYYNFDKKYMHTVSGNLDLPLNPDNINNELFHNIETTYRCPYGIYYVSNKTIACKILHEDIEYIQRVDNKSVIHLCNGETETVYKNLKKIKEELNEEYFIKNHKGYIVNLFNIKKVYKDSSTIELKSGTLLPLPKRKSQYFLKAYMLSMEGLKIWNN